MAAERPESGLREAGAAHPLLFLAVALVLALGMIYYYSGVLIPLRQRQAQLAGAARGNWSDLYPSWLAARELLWHGRNPYSADMTQEIQRGFYGRPIDRAHHNDPTDVEAFAYPVYVAFVLAPILPFSFDAVRPVFAAALLLLTAASLPLWLRGLRLRLRPWAVLLAWVATMSSYAVVDGLHLQQITLVVAFFMAASIAALAGGRLMLAGVLLALATVKPHLAILVVVFLLVWTLGEWRSRKWFALGFGGAMASLLTGSELVLPGWFRFWRQAAQAFVGYHKPSLLESLFGRPVAMVVGAGAIFLCAGLFWRFRNEPPASGQFNFALVAALVLTALLLPNAGSANYNQVLLIPAAVWLFTPGWTLAQKSGLARLTWLIAVNALAWEWILALPVSFAALVLRHSFEREATPLVAGPELLAFFFPLALGLFVLSAAPRLWRTGWTRCEKIVAG